MLYFFVAFSAKLLTEGDAIYAVYTMTTALAVITKLSIKRNYRAITPD
jgi:hypothetical protein